MPKLTIMDIARMSGFSKSTVSRVLTGDRRVSAAARERIMRVVGEQDFRPNELARGMVSGSLDIVMIIAGDIANYFYGIAVKALQNLLDGAGYPTVVCSSEYDAARELNYLRMARRYRMAGVVLMTAMQSPELIELLRDVDMPVLLMNRYLDGIELDAVVQDNRRCAYLATRHLIDMGHRRILHISSGSGATTSRDRRAGYVDAMAEAGLDVTSGMVLAGDLTMASGYAHALRIIEQGLPCTAAFIGNDMMTVGFVKAWTESGRTIPGDISVICFDTSPFIELLPVRMSTVGRPGAELGQRAAELLLERLRGLDCPPRRVVLEADLQVRDSVRALAGDK